MKQRPQPLPERTIETDLERLARAFAALDKPAEVRAFLEDLCTPAELEALSDRWKVVPLLRAGVPYREIHERTLVSVTTIGRVARSAVLLRRDAAGGPAAGARRRHPGADRRGRVRSRHRRPQRARRTARRVRGARSRAAVPRTGRARLRPVPADAGGAGGARLDRRREPRRPAHRH